jgi:pimeloyl-ACP methyl ester carboxylesterase
MTSAATRDACGAFEQLAPRRLALRNGVELHAVQAGEGPALIFVHGAMGDWRSWAPQWDAFTARYRCVAYSRRFSFPNRNAAPAPDHSALDEAQDLELLMDALGLDEAIVVGSSYGGFTALALAVRQPRRVRALVAVEPPMMKYASFTPEGQAAAQAFREQTIEPANAAFRAGDDTLGAQIMTGGINGAGSPVASGEAMRRRLQNVGAMKALALSSDEFPLLPPASLAALPMPALLIAGADTQPVHKAIFTNVCAAMPQARHQWIAGTGHSVTRNQPEAFNEAALGFLEAVLGQPTTAGH